MSSYRDETLESDAREEAAYRDRVAAGLAMCECGDWFREDLEGESRDNDHGLPYCAPCRLERKIEIGGGDGD